MMKKEVFVLLLYLFPLWFLFAHPNGKMHDDDLHCVLFGTKYIYNGYENLDVDKIEKLDAALYLYLDYCSGNEVKGQRCLDMLSDVGLGIGLEQISFGKDGGPHHERYTHLGWDEKWYQGGKNARAKYKLRRGILLKTVRKSFESSGADERQIELFAKLCYYVHILGDHQDNSATTAKTRMMLVQRANAKKQITVIDELISICGELFKSQVSASLLNRLTGIQNSAGTIDDTSENGNFMIHYWATQVLDALEDYVPDLLKDWDPFVKSFYDEESQEDELAA